jgi:hypothetical protein
MGAYTYRVTAKKVTLPDGSSANLAVYAYKPYWNDALNARMHFSTGCYAAERYVSKHGRMRVVLDENSTHVVTVNCGTFTDDWFDYQKNEYTAQ